MTNYFEQYGGTGPENYERFFVPAIGGPLAVDIVAKAELKAGHRVLDVACGTGIVARLAAERAGGRTIAGLDISAPMIQVARVANPTITWYDANAEAMPLADGSFDVAICQLGVQFVKDKTAALREMRRVLVPGGRALVSVVGPMPALFAVLREELAEQIGPQAGAFVDVVFSLHEPATLRAMFLEAGYSHVEAAAESKTLRLPSPAEFLWQYIRSTPLAGPVGQASAERRATLEARVVDRWQPFMQDGVLICELPVTVARGQR